ncbi:hypothetical protein GCM10009670_27130 [Citricoccus alkalitolerans]
MTALGARRPPGTAIEGSVDGHPVSVLPVPATAAGHLDWVALAASLPSPPADGPRLPVPDGWVQIPLAGAEQTLFLAEGARYEGIMPQVSLRHVRSTALGDLLTGDVAARWLPLGIEPWTAGAWRGVHVSWSLSRYASTVIRRQWMLDDRQGGLWEVVAETNAYLSHHLSAVLDGMVAGILPAPAAESGLTADLAWSVAAAEEARGRLPAPAADGLVQASAHRGEDRDRIVSGFGADEPAWIIEAGRDHAATVRPRLIGRVWTHGAEALVESSAAGPETAGPETVGLGRYTRDDAADMMLRLVGHRPEGPADVPARLLPAEEFSARLHDPTIPLPTEVPSNAEISQAMDPQDIYRWWTADWSWWSVRRNQDGLRVLTVEGFGHYLWDGAGGVPGADGSMVRVRPVDGLTLFGALTALVGPAGASSDAS